MAVADVVSEGAKKAGGIFFLPGGRLNWWITGFFFTVLIIVSVVNGVHEKSVYPLFKNTVLRLVSADAQIDEAVQSVRSNDLSPKYSSWVKYINFFDPWWLAWAGFWFTILSCLWFMYFFFMICFNLFNALDSTSVVSATIGAIIFYILIMSYGNVLFYHASLAGSTLPVDEKQVLVDDLAHGVPLGGVYRLILLGWNGDLWQKVADLADEGIVGSASNIPSAGVD